MVTVCEDDGMARALVTGCARGLGRATALRLAEDGWDVSATMRHPDRDGPELLARAEAAGVELAIQQLDITDEPSLVDAFERAGEVDLLVNNAAVSSLGSVEESSLDDWRRVLDTNLLGTIRCMQAVLPGMRKRRSGCIINVTTVAVPVVFPGTGAYAASKAAIEHASEVAAIEARPFGVRIVVLEPGQMLTTMQPTGSPPPADSPYLAIMGNTGAYLAANAPYASRVAVVAATIALAPQDPDTPFRVATGQVAPETIALRGRHTDAEWHDLLSSSLFTDSYQPPVPSRSSPQ
jgi:NAD(P)-dependent dehydrogenase (short-subunit alcohol dehydrogenase family)